MIRPDPQQLYTAVQRIAHAEPAPSPDAFRTEGGQITAPSDDPSDMWDWQRSQWWAELYGIHASGESEAAAVEKWARRARQFLPRRASDGRPDCPYNGQGLAP